MVTTRKPLRAAIIGLGRLGERHARHLVNKIQGVKLVAACALDSNQLEWAKNELGVETTYTNYKDMIDTENIDAIFIVAPTPFHPEMTIYAMNAGLNVF